MSAVPAALAQHRIDAGTVNNATLGEAMATGNFRSPKAFPAQELISPYALPPR
jgi:hypothetical protein